MTIFIWEMPEPRFTRAIPVSYWHYCPHPDDHPWHQHDRNPLWGRAVLLGAFIASGGDL